VEKMMAKKSIGGWQTSWITWKIGGKSIDWEGKEIEGYGELAIAGQTNAFLWLQMNVKIGPENQHQRTNVKIGSN
jgi:hypothetical protein